MKIREAIAQLSAFPQDLELLDEYAENAIGSFYVSTYDDGSENSDYVAYDTLPVDD